MNDHEFLTWCKRYCNAFLQDLSRINETLKEWRVAFNRAEFSADELNRALDAMIDNPPEDRWQHLRRISRFVWDSRAIELQSQATLAETRAETMGECLLCGSTGWVTVPSLRCINNMGDFVPVLLNAAPGAAARNPNTRTVFIEGVVSCRCAMGSFQEERGREYWEKRRKQTGLDKQPLSLGEYERRNPNWKSQLDSLRGATQQIDHIENRMRREDRDQKKLGMAIVRNLSDSLAMPSAVPVEPSNSKSVQFSKPNQ